MKLKVLFVAVFGLFITSHVLSASATNVITATVATTPLIISSLSKNLNGNVGSFLSAHFIVGGGTAPYVWQVQNLPAGLYQSLLPSYSSVCAPPADDYLVTDLSGRPNGCPPPYTSGEDMLISGTPTVAGSFTTTFSVTDASGVTGVGNFTFTIATSGTVINPLSISTDDTYLTATVGRPFLVTLVASGGARPYAWKVSGQLPPGVGRSYAAFNCIMAPCNPPVDLYDSLYLSGTPTATGAYTYAVQVTDASGRITSKTFTTTVGSYSQDHGITVTAPKSTDVWSLGKTYSISWTNTTGSARAIPLSITLHPPRPGCLDIAPPCKLLEVSPYVITSSTVDTGIFTWTVPQDLPAAFQGSQQITVAALGGGINGTSSLFTIGQSNNEERSLNVSSPASGEVWPEGQARTIRWTPSTANSTVTISASKYISCLHNPVYVCAVAQPAPLLISTSAPDTGSFVWSVPRDSSLLGDFTVVVSNNTSHKTGESGVFKITDFGTDQPCSKIQVGQLVVGVLGTVYVITAPCSKYGFTSLQDFTSRGYNLRQVVRVDQSLLDAIPTVYALQRSAGVSFKYAGSPAVYYLTSSQCKQVYPSLATFNAWKVSFRDVVNFANSEQYPDCSPSFVQIPDNSPVKALGNGTVFLIRSGARYPFASFSAFLRKGFTLRQIIVVPEGELNMYPLGGIIEYDDSKPACPKLGPITSDCSPTVK